MNFHNYPYTSILGWSHSRNQIFQNCKRRYYLQYYFKHLPTEEKKKVKAQRALITENMYVGDVCHRLIEVFLRKIQKNKLTLDTSKFKNYIIKLVAQEFNKLYFEETFYLGTIINQHDLVEKIYAKSLIFYNSDFYQWLIKLVKENHTDTRQWIIEPHNYGETRLGGNKAYCILDFLMPLKDKFYIFDWKTGNAKETHNFQILAYALTAKEEYGIDPYAIITEIVYIQKDKIERRHYDPDESEINALISTIESQSKEMYKYCSNIDENIPKPISIFTKTDNHSTCKYCKFKSYCNRT